MKLGRVFTWLDPVVLASLYLASKLITDPSFATSEGLYPLIEIGIVYGPVLLFRFQNRLWQYASINDIADYVKIIFIYVLGFIYIIVFDRSITEYVVLVIGSGLYLFISRFYLRFAEVLRPRKKRTNVIVYGAGDGGNIVYKESFSKMNIIGFIDDNQALIGSQLHSLPVYSYNDLPELIQTHDVKEVIIAIPSLSQVAQLKKAKELLQFGIRVRVLSSIEEMKGDVSRLSTKQIQIEDVLGRDVVTLDQEEMPLHLQGKRVLITGAGGSIGSELARQVIRYDIEQLVLLDQYENNLYDLEQSLKRSHPNKSSMIKPVIANVQDRERLEEVIKLFQPHILFHAAAHKHVPLMEDAPDEAIKNNVFGSFNVLSLADIHGVDQVVVISTDKAVNPTNVMGATKRVVELMMQGFAKTSKTKFSAVRFGNVLGSHGSVIPLFEAQIAAGGPVTVTDEQMKRYFMTIPEACQLILESAIDAKGGEIFVLDMGEPIKILDLAKQMIRLAGYEPYQEIEITITGLRPGEKLFEELLLDESTAMKTARDKIFVEKPTNESIDLTKIMDIKYVRTLVDSIKAKGIKV